MALESPPSVWVVHAGRGGRDAKAFEAAGIVGLALPPIRGLGDMDPGMARAVITEALAQDKPDIPLQSGRDRSLAALLLRFIHGVRIGDRVGTPDGSADEVLFGIISGDYSLVDRPAVEGYYHVRSVRWLGRMKETIVAITGRPFDGGAESAVHARRGGADHGSWDMA